jgi:hypothetical protein
VAFGDELVAIPRAESEIDWGRREKEIEDKNNYCVIFKDLQWVSYIMQSVGLISVDECIW